MTQMKGVADRNESGCGVSLSGHQRKYVSKPPTVSLDIGAIRHNVRERPSRSEPKSRIAKRAAYAICSAKERQANAAAKASTV